MSLKQRAPIRFDRVLFYSLVIIVFGSAELALIPLGIYQPYDQIFSPIFVAVSNLGAAIAIITLIPSVVVIYRKHSIVKRINEMTRSVDLDDYQYRQSRPSYLLADSVDRMILEILKSTSGDFEVIPEMMVAEGVYIDDSPSGEYESKLAKLVMLGFVAIPNKRYRSRLYLTARALDALNAPASLFITNIPDDVWQHVFRMKLNLRKGEWDAVAVHMAAALELMLLKRVNDVKNRNQQKWVEMVNRNPRLENPLGLGKQLAALRSVGNIEKNSFEDLLVGDLVEIRNEIHLSRCHLSRMVK